jgi:hypothetical protein
VEKRRSCERLLQVSVETAIDVCALVVSGNELIFETVTHRLGDFDTFRREILAFLGNAPGNPGGP